MRSVVRSLVFALSIILGAASWLIFAGGAALRIASAQQPDASPVSANEGDAQAAEPQISQAELMSFEEAGMVNGYTSTERLPLRRNADANSQPFTTLEVTLDQQVKILDSTRDFLLVRLTVSIEQDNGEMADETFEGWAAWGDVLPNMSALVLDPATGEVVSRVPLQEDQAAVSFSPDGSRALFYTTNINEEAVMAYEVRTDDYTRTRSLVAHSTRWLSPLFYGSDSQLSAFVLPSAETGKRLQLLRLGDSGNLSEPTAINAAINFFVSDDRRMGFFYHPQDGETAEGEEPSAALDIVDLQTQKVVNTIRIRGQQVRPGDGLMVSADGTELYVNRQDEETIEVVDTRTGEHLRELAKKLPAHAGAYLNPSNVVGDSLFVYYWSDSAGDDEHTRAHTGWLTSAGFVAADEGIGSAIETGGARYAVNDEGTLIFKLDQKNHIRERHTIARPEIRSNGETVYGLSTFGLAASPDGKHLIVFVGIEQGC